MLLNEMISEDAKKGAALGIFKDPTMKMCHDCAFKKGTEANNDPNAVQAAVDAMSSCGMFGFNCHNEFLEDAGRPCIGFLYAKQYYESRDIMEDNIELPAIAGG